MTRENDDRTYLQGPEDFIAALERHARTQPLILIDDPLAEARHYIIDEYAWPSGMTMWQLLRTLTGSPDDFFEGEEEVWDEWGLSVATSLVAAKRNGMYPEDEWRRVMDQVEELVVVLDESAWYSGNEPRSV